MAKIVEEVVVLKFSKIIKDNEHDPEPPVTNESIYALVQVAQELVGNAIVVEVERA